MALDWYGRELKDRGHLYAPLILPHDARARELGTGKSREEMLQAMGFRTRIAPQVGVQDGIETVRRMLPRTWADEGRCRQGLSALRDYRQRVDAQRGLSLGQGGRQLSYDYDGRADRTGIGRLLADLNARGIGVRDVATRQSSLEDVFLSLLEEGAAR